MRTTIRRPIATSMLLTGAMLLLTGCGDTGSHLPAGMSGSSAAHSGAAEGGLLGGDPGPLDAGVGSGVDDLVLTGYDGVEAFDSPSGDDPFSRASQDWSDAEGSLGTGLGSGLDDLGLDDDPMPVGYGRGAGLDDAWGYGGYGNGILSAAGYGGWGGSAGLMDAGFSDAGMGMDDFGGAGLEDPGFVDGGFDAGFVDAGMDVGFVDAGFDAGFDPGFADAGVADVGFDPGFADVGVADAGFADLGGGFDAGFVF